MPTGVLHHLSLGIHPSAFFQPTTPTPQRDGQTWIDTSVGPPYQEKVWHEASHTWETVGVGGGSVPAVTADGHVTVACFTFPYSAQICNPSFDVVNLATPSGEFVFGPMGVAIPGGHLVENVRG